MGLIHILIKCLKSLEILKIYQISSKVSFFKPHFLPLLYFLTFFFFFAHWLYVHLQTGSTLMLSRLVINKWEQTVQLCYRATQPTVIKSFGYHLTSPYVSTNRNYIAVDIFLKKAVNAACLHVQSERKENVYCSNIELIKRFASSIDLTINTPSCMQAHTK